MSLFFLLLPCLSSAEVFTLIKENTTTCVLTKDSVYSPFYPLSKNRRPLSEITSWITDDWTVGTTEEFSFYPVTDIRWEGFQNKSDGKIELNSKSSTSFSVCFGKSLTLHFGLKMVTLHQKKTEKEGCQWGHYVVQNETIFRVTNGNETTEIEKLIGVPRSLTVPTKKIYKKHDYSFRYSTKWSEIYSSIRIGQVATSFPLCISFFVSIDEGCSLEVILSSNSIVTKTIEGFNTKNVRSWRRETIKVKFYRGEGKLYFKRTGKSSGFWAIDNIHLCKPEIETFTTNSSCKTLENTESTGDVLCSTPGFLGFNCSTNCTFLANDKFCEKTKICSGNKCACSWGYQGEFCDKPCDDQQFGLNCSSKSNFVNCKNYSTVVGCVECVDGFFGKSCSDKLPVVLNPPKLLKIDNKSVEISLGKLEYGENEAVPTHYVVQYKKEGEETFRDFSEKKPYIRSPKTVVLNLEPNRYRYRIRVLLKVDEVGEEDVPELLTFKMSLKAEVSGTIIKLRWERQTPQEFTVEYMCNNSCQHQTTSSITTSQTEAVLSDIMSSSVCTIKLLQKELIDEITVSTSKNSSLPTVSLSKSTVKLIFPDCSYPPSTYFLFFQGHKKWCQHKNVTIENVKNVKTKLKEVDLVPFCNYTIKVQTNNESVSYNVTSPPSKPQPVTHFSVYSNTKDTFYLRWKPAYPPTGVIKGYKTTSGESTVNTSFECAIWKEYMCSKLDGLKPGRFYNIEIQAKNEDVSEWSDKTSLTFSTTLQESHPPLNLHLELSNEVVVKWEHPLYTYGLLEEYNIDVDNDTHLKLQARENYEFKFPVEANEDYEVLIWGTTDQSSKSKAVLNVSVFPPIPQISFNILVQWCNNSCYLLVPNDKSLKIMVKEKHVVYHSSSSKILVVKLDLVKIEEISYYQEALHHILSIKTMNISAFDVAASKSNSTVTIIVITLSVFVIFGVGGYIGYKFQRRCRKAPLRYPSEYIYLLPQMPSTLIKIEDLEDYVRSLHEATNLTRLKHFFLKIPRENTSCSVASNEVNLNKNKDQLHIPCDSTRVVLQDLEGVSCGDYINASYIDGYQHTQTYIACQGPKFNTVSDFWRMIWTERVDTIVMATDFVETDGNRNSAEYWSQCLNKVAEFGTLTVKMTTEKVYQFYTFRIFEVWYSGCVRQVRHLQTKWTQDRCPHPEEVLAVLQRLWSLESLYPIVIHSGFGTNRTGMLILCDLAVKMAKSEGGVDFVNLLKKLRDQRPLIIHKFEYFILTHLTVLECLLEEQNPFRQPVEKILESNCVEQVGFLERLSLHDCVLLPQLSNQENRLWIKQQPTKKDIFEFWEATLKNNFRFVVCLNLPKDQLWPLKMRNSGVKLTVVDEEIKQISPDSSATQLLVQQSYTKRNEVLREKKVWLYELLDWDYKKVLPESNTNILSLLQHLRDNVEENDHVILVSHPESNASRIISIVFNALEKYESESEIDVYTFLRNMMRNDRSFRIQSIELKFIYGAVADYLANFDLKTHVYEDME